jgi:hypothetical protein
MLPRYPHCGRQVAGEITPDFWGCNVGVHPREGGDICIIFSADTSVTVLPNSASLKQNTGGY